MIKYSRIEIQSFEKYFFDHIVMNENINFYEWMKKDYGATLEVKRGLDFLEVDKITFDTPEDELLFRLKFGIKND